MTNSGDSQDFASSRDHKMRVDLSRDLLRSSTIFPLHGHHLGSLLLTILGRRHFPCFPDEETLAQG